MSHYLSIRGIGQPIAYFPKLSIYLGCINAGVLLGQMIFWHDKTDNPLGVYKTAEEITQETGLSYKQQINARKKLVSLGLITETYKRLDHRLFFKFNVERFDEWFTEMLLANEPNVSSRTAQTEVREELKGQIVIQKNTTKNTSKITTKKKATSLEKNNSKAVSHDSNLNLNLSDKQIDYFANLLASDPMFGSTHAVVGESGKEFAARIKKLMKDPTWVAEHIVDLQAVGFGGAV